MSGGFKWIELGIHHVIFDDEDGRIVGYIVVDAPNARKCPIPAFIDGKSIGIYITAEFARRAVEEAMGERHRNSLQNSGRVHPVLPMDERAWIESQ